MHGHLSERLLRELLGVILELRERHKLHDIAHGVLVEVLRVEDSIGVISVKATKSGGEELGRSGVTFPSAKNPHFQARL